MGAIVNPDYRAFYVVFTLSDKFRPYICKLFVFKRVLTLFLLNSLALSSYFFHALRKRKPTVVLAELVEFWMKLVW